MAEYKSRYSELGFYVNDSLRQFRAGKYITDVKAEIDVLDGMKDVTKVTENKQKETVQPKTQAGAKPKKATPKTPKKAKSSAKK